MDVQNLMVVMMKAEFVDLHVVIKEQYFVEVTFYFASYWRHLIPFVRKYIEFKRTRENYLLKLVLKMIYV